MVKLLGISGSLRRGSYNSALLRAATRLMPDEATLEVASIRGIPLYDGDVEAQGIPASVSQLKEAVVAADGVLLVDGGSAAGSDALMNAIAALPGGGHVVRKFRNEDEVVIAKCEIGVDDSSTEFINHRLDRIQPVLGI